LARAFIGVEPQDSMALMPGSPRLPFFLNSNRRQIPGARASAHLAEAVGPARNGAQRRPRAAAPAWPRPRDPGCVARPSSAFRANGKDQRTAEHRCRPAPQIRAAAGARPANAASPGSGPRRARRRGGAAAVPGTAGRCGAGNRGVNGEGA
jgi:hypothetical protein